MQVYKTFFKVAKKYTGGCILYLVIFLVLMFSMSALSSSEENDKFKASKVNFTVIDEDHTDASKALITYLKGKHNLVKMKSYDAQTLQDNLYYEQISYILTIPKGYEENILNKQFENILSHTKKPDTAAGFFFNQDISAYLNTLRLNLEAGYSLKDSLTETENTVKNTNTDVETIEFEKTTDKKDNGIYYFFQYYAYIAISILIVGMAPILIAFHKKDLAARVNCSSYTKVKQTTELGFGCITYSIALWLVLVLAAVVAYGPGAVFSTNGLLCVLNSFVYLFVIGAITLLIGSFSLNSSTLSLVSNVIGLGTSFLCGVFVPLWLLSDKVVAFSKFLPAYWYIRNNNMVSGFTGEALEMSTYWKNLGIQCIFAVAIFCIYLVVNQNKKKN